MNHCRLTLLKVILLIIFLYFTFDFTASYIKAQTITSKNLFVKEKQDPFTWTGKIVKQNNTPLQNAKIYLYLRDSSDAGKRNYVLNANTDANGNFVFNELSTSVEKLICH
ncbi:MAG: hypothetical protein FJ214_07755 [Ignavibacteria bacterium]|nr:hypothetical protein [Ignavibacteria bacterium]